MTRRSLALALAGGTALAQPPASPDEELAAARKQLQSNGENLAKFEIPMATEPAFVFKA
jgi:hypothetical protein